jgi:hypothetical protein
VKFFKSCGGMVVNEYLFLYQFWTILPRGPVRVISYWSNVTTGGNVNFIYTG